MMKTAGTLGWGGNVTCRKGSEIALEKGESARESLPFLLDLLQGYIQWKEKPVPERFLKSLVTQRQIMLHLLFTRVKEAGTQWSVIWGLPCPMVKIRDHFCTKGSKHHLDLRDGNRVSAQLGCFPWLMISFLSASPPPLPWEVLDMFFQTYDFSYIFHLPFSQVPLFPLFPIWTPKRKTVTWAPNSQNTTKVQTKHRLHGDDCDQQVTLGVNL